MNTHQIRNTLRNRRGTLAAVGAVAAATLALMACGGSESDPATAPVVGATPVVAPPTALDELVGTWLSACRTTGATSVSWRLDVAVDGAGVVSFTAVQNEFSDAACTTSSATPTLTGTLDPASLTTDKTWKAETTKRFSAQVTGVATNGWSGSLSQGTPYSFDVYYVLSGNQLTLGKAFRLITSTPLTKQ